MIVLDVYLVSEDYDFCFFSGLYNILIVGVVKRNTNSHYKMCRSVASILKLCNYNGTAQS